MSGENPALPSQSNRSRTPGTSASKTASGPKLRPETPDQRIDRHASLRVSRRMMAGFLAVAGLLIVAAAWQGMSRGRPDQTASAVSEPVTPQSASFADVDAAGAQSAAVSMDPLPRDVREDRTPVADTALPNAVPVVALADDKPTQQQIEIDAEVLMAEKLADEVAAPELPVPQQELFVPVIAWYETASTSQRVAVESSIKKMLTQDWESRTVTGETVRRRFETASQTCRADPRIPFAWGLYLQKSKQPSGAVQQFEASTTWNPMFLAGYQATAFHRLSQGDTRRGLERLEKLIDRLAVEGDTSPSAQAKLQAANWIGRTLGFLEHAAVRKPDDAELTALQSRIQTKLSAELQAGVEQGQQVARGHFAELDAIASKPNDELIAELRTIRTADQRLLASIQADLTRQREDIRQGKGELDQLEGSLRKASVQVREENKRVAALSHEITNLQRGSYGNVYDVQIPKYRRVREKESFFNSTTGKQETRTVTREQLDGYKIEKRQAPETAEQTSRRLADIRARQEQLNSANQEVDQSREQLRKMHEGVGSTRRETRIEYRTLHQQVMELAEQERDLIKQIAQYDGFIARPATFKAYIRTIDPYVPWDIEVQRQLVLDSFARPPVSSANP